MNPRAAANDASKNLPSGQGGTSPEPAEAWHTLSVEETVQRLRADVTRGLTNAEVSLRHAKYGPNALAEVTGRSALAIFIHQFRSLIVVLLLAAGGVAFALGENVEAIAILIVIVLNAAIGFLTEWKAEQALVALRKQTVPVTHVVRDGEERQIPTAELVPGDLAVLAAGARVPADGRVVESIRLQVEEAALTGESLAVSKTTDPLPDEDAPLGDRINMVHMGTAVTDGRARFIVTATSMFTEMGKIGTLIEEAGTRGTPLERKLAHLGRVLLVIVPVLCAIIAAGGLASRQQLPLHAGDRHLTGDRGCAGGAARRGDHDARAGDAADGRHARSHPPPARGRDPRLNYGHLHGQDRDAHAERDDGPRRAAR